MRKCEEMETEMLEMKEQGKTRDQIKEVMVKKYYYYSKTTINRYLQKMGMGIYCGDKLKYAKKLYEEGYEKKTAIEMLAEKFNIPKKTAYVSVHKMYGVTDQGKDRIKRKTVITTCNFPNSITGIVCGKKFETEVDEFGVRVHRRCQSCQRIVENSKVLTRNNISI